MKKVLVLFSALILVVGAGAPVAADVTGYVDHPEGNSMDWQSDVTALGGIVNTSINFNDHSEGLLQNDFYSTSEGVTLAIVPDYSVVEYGQGPEQGNTFSGPLSEGEGVHEVSNYLLVEGNSVSFTITFAAPVYGAGLFVIDYFDPRGMAPLTISAYAQDGSLLGSYSSVQFNFQTDKQYFMGVTSSDGDIGSLVFTADTSITMDSIGIDDIRFATVELVEPEELVEPLEEPEISDDSLLQFFDDAVDAGTLQGNSSREWVDYLRLLSTRKMIVSAVTAVEQGRTRQACKKLKKIYRRCDGKKRPADFVVGEAAPQLAAMIEELRTSLGCKPQTKHARHMGK